MAVQYHVDITWLFKKEVWMKGGWRVEGTVCADLILFLEIETWSPSQWPLAQDHVVALMTTVEWGQAWIIYTYNLFWCFLLSFRRAKSMESSPAGRILVSYIYWCRARVSWWWWYGRQTSALKGLCKGDVGHTNSGVRMSPQNSLHLLPLLVDKLETLRRLMGHLPNSGRDHTQGSWLLVY